MTKEKMEGEMSCREREREREREEGGREGLRGREEKERGSPQPASSLLIESFQQTSALKSSPTHLDILLSIHLCVCVYRVTYCTNTYYYMYIF